MRIKKRHLYKTKSELRSLVSSGLLTRSALDAVGQRMRAGITTAELDTIAQNYIKDNGGSSAFKQVPGYRHTICASVNDAVVHGIPSKRELRPGDIVSIDCGAMVDGWFGDCARTWIIQEDGTPWLNPPCFATLHTGEHTACLSDLGEFSHSSQIQAAMQLSMATKQAMWDGIAAAATAKDVAEIGAAIENSIKKSAEMLGVQYSSPPQYTGHGIGKYLHEDPIVYNYKTHKVCPIRPGLAICIEPMIIQGLDEVYTESDGWTVRSKDASPAAHWENMVLFHEDGIWVATEHDGGAHELAQYGITPVAIL